MRILAALGLMALVPLAWAQKTVHIDIASPTESYALWGGELSQGVTVEVPLELGADPYGALLTIADRDNAEYRVSVRFETSLAVGAEGPHIDLIDFKHCLSEWVPATSSDGRSFALPTPTDLQRDCVPAASMYEVRQALRAQLLRDGMRDAVDEWTGFVQEVKRSGDPPMYAGISRVFVRIEVKLKGMWEPAGTVVFLPPMGC